MSGEASVTKVTSRLNTWLASNIGTGVDLHVARPFDQPFRDGDLPAVNIRAAKIEIEQLTYDTEKHTMLTLFDIHAPSQASGSIQDDQAEIAAAIADRMSAMAPTSGTIGELLQNAEPVRLGPEEDDLLLSDHGQMTLAYRLVWLAPVGDLRTISGNLGLVA